MFLKIMNTAVCRTPVFSKEVTIDEVWEDLKLKIKESSPVFYQSIKNLHSDEIYTADKKIWFTIWKYFKRAKYRPTPFGSFAAVSLVPVSDLEASQISISNKMYSHSFNDWGEIEQIIHNISGRLNNSVLIRKNSSIYYVSDEIRYVRLRNEKFEIGIVKSIPQLITVLEACTSCQTVSNLCDLMQTVYNMPNRQTIGLLRQMLSLQLIITDRFPNIIGQDYFERVGNTRLVSDINYIISERNCLNGSLGMGSLQELPGMISFLKKVTSDIFNDDLSNFKVAFKKKFEDREISLAHVMDPEIGIGYGSFEQQSCHETITVLKAEQTENQINIAYSSFHAFILNKLMQSQPIQLEEFDDSSVYSNQPLPNTFSAMFHFYNGVIVMENLGGSTANNLIGRFTIAGQKIEDYAKTVSSVEESANPEVIFFDIAYQAEKKIDNVNRRKKIYEQELPILTWPCSENLLDFEDIMVSVQGGTVMLRSKKYRKRLVPRIPSAYNYTRSDLAVYRFLCDIQNQDLKTSLNFDLRSYFPNLERYPRVKYKSVIVSPAMWLVPRKIINTGEIDHLTVLKWLDSERINFPFKAGNADNMLCFDPAIREDMTAFLMYCKQQKDAFYIYEALIDNSGMVKDEKGRSYCAQFIVSCYHERQLYGAFPVKSSPYAGNEKKGVLLPGSDWMYYELYVYPTRSDDLLINQLRSFLKEVKPNLKKWFFIRYDSPAPHIRLRLHLRDPELSYRVNATLTARLEPYIYSGQLNDFCIKTYYREMERYGADRIELIEKIFHLDSEYVLSIIAKNKAPGQVYVFTLRFINDVFLCNFTTIDEQILFVQYMASHFAAEVNLKPNQFSDMNKAYNELRIKPQEILTGSDTVNLKYKALVKTVLAKIYGREKDKLIADLIHMHINRLFTSDQRLHETLLYHFLLRYLKAFRAHLKPQVRC